jgi:hypothetical protein
MCLKENTRVVPQTLIYNVCGEGSDSIERIADIMATLTKCTIQIVCSLVCIGSIGCGGGTTGTSPTDSLKFSGFAQQADGERAGSLSMTVRSGETEEPLVDSGTDANGEFVMKLPASEQSLIVNVTGVGDARVDRSQKGAGAIAATLDVTEQGVLEIGQVFEAQAVATNSQCGVTVAGTAVQVGDGGVQESCVVRIAVASKALPLETFQGALIARCRGALEVLSVSRIGAASEIEVDLQPALAQECEDMAIEVSSTRNSELVSSFSVQVKR